MSTIQIDGKWSGTFNYDDTYPLSYRNKLTPFIITFRFEDGVISGECEDEITKQLLLKPATIEGTFEDNTIHFIKRYSCLVEVDENDKLKANFKEPSMGIQYNGSLHKKLFSKKHYFKGSWDISGTVLDESQQILYYTMGGFWKMEKVE